jgi:hypothetical protein
MAPSTVPSTGSFRVQLKTPRGWVRVGAFLTLTGADQYARDIAHADQASAVKVEYFNQSRWKPVRSWSLGPRREQTET